MPIDELLRFKDLQRLNVVKSWTQLRYMQEHYGFPEGMLLGENTRAWATCKVKEWLEARPAVSTLVRERAKKSVRAKRRSSVCRDGDGYMRKSPSANGGQGLKGCSAPSKQTNIYPSAPPTASTNSPPRRAKHPRQPKRSGRRELALYDGQNLLGIIKVTGNGKSIAYDSQGKRLGTFTSFRKAADAVEVRS